MGILTSIQGAPVCLRAKSLYDKPFSFQDMNANNLIKILRGIFFESSPSGVISKQRHIRRRNVHWQISGHIFAMFFIQLVPMQIAECF